MFFFYVTDHSKAVGYFTKAFLFSFFCELLIHLRPLIMLAAGGILWFCDWKVAFFRDRFAKAQPATRLAFVGLLGLVVLLFGMYGIGFEASGFIYGGF